MDKENKDPDWVFYSRDKSHESSFYGKTPGVCTNTKMELEQILTNTASRNIPHEDNVTENYWANPSQVLSAGDRERDQLSTVRLERDQISTVRLEGDQISTVGLDRVQLSTGSLERGQLSAGVRERDQLSTGRWGSYQLSTVSHGRDQLSTGRLERDQLSTGRPERDQLLTVRQGSDQLSTERLQKDQKLLTAHKNYEMMEEGEAGGEIVHGAQVELAVGLSLSGEGGILSGMGCKIKKKRRRNKLRGNKKKAGNLSRYSDREIQRQIDRNNKQFSEKVRVEVLKETLGNPWDGITFDEKKHFALHFYYNHLQVWY